MFDPVKESFNPQSRRDPQVENCHLGRSREGGVLPRVTGEQDKEGRR